MRLRSGVWAALVGLGLVGACSDLETPAGVAAEDGGGVPETSSPDAPVTPSNDAEVDSSDAGTDSAADAGDAADADGGVVYAGNHLWSRLYGEPDSLLLSSPAMIPGPLGSVYYSSNFSGTVSFDNGASVTGPSTNAVNPNAPNCFIARIDKNGAHVWSKSFVVTAQSDSVACKVVGSDASGVYVHGGFAGVRDVGGGDLPAGGYLAKYDHAGAHLWSKSIPAATARVVGLVGGDLVVFARGTGNPDYGGGALVGTGLRSFVARLTGASGAHVWSKQSVGAVNPRAVTGDSNGNAVIAGSLPSSVDWGAGTVTSAGVEDAFVAKFDAAGNLAWTKVAGGPNLDEARAVAVNATGDVFVAGIAQGTFDIGTGPITPTYPTVNYRETAFVAKLSPTGTATWAKVWSTNGPDVRATANGVATDAAGNVIVTGTAHCGLDFGGGALAAKDGIGNWFVAKLSPTGGHLWSKGWAAIGGNGAGGGSAAVDTDGNTLLLGGLNQTTIDMGGGPLTAGGDRDDHVLAKFGP